MFAAGLTKMLASYPEAVVWRACDPVEGIPGVVAFLNLAEIRKHLDSWRTEFLIAAERVERANRKVLSEPEVDPKERQRIGECLKQLSEHLKAQSGSDRI